MMIEDMPLIDILASWRFEEEYFSKELQNAYKIDFEPYNPFWSDVPWTAALENKKVLVVHPFAETIQKQYLRKELIHKDPRVLPTFDLQSKPFKLLAIKATVDSKHGLTLSNS